jgi:hypothetical protein
MVLTVACRGTIHDSGEGWSIVVTNNCVSDSFYMLSQTAHATMRVAALSAAATAFKTFDWSASKIGTLKGSWAQLADFSSSPTFLS